MNSSFVATILIPTYNRPTDLNCNIKYIKENADFSKIRFIVLDGSEPNIAETNEQLCRDLTIEYHYYDADITFQERVVNGLKLVDTELVSILADDDLLDFKGFIDCVYFLQQHKDYSCAHGQYIAFQRNADGNIKNLNDIYQSPSYEDDNPLVRLYSHLSEYTVHELFAVARTDTMKVAYKAMIDIGHLEDKYLCYELIYIAILTVSGKIKRLPSHYYKRQIDTSPSLLQINNFNIARYVFNEKFPIMYRDVKGKILQEMQLSTINQEAASEAIDLSFGAYYGSCLHLDRMNACFAKFKLPGFIQAQKTTGFLLKKILKTIYSNMIRSR